jgi:hypothetical protein
MNIEDADDISYTFVSITSWSTSELTSGILCASLPTLRPLVIKLFPSRFSKQNTGYVYDSAGNRITATGASKPFSRVIESEEYPLKERDMDSARPYDANYGLREE